jgi:decaprenylphospho-beta-D-ribofuranose 2-oxidase
MNPTPVSGWGNAERRLCTVLEGPVEDLRSTIEAAPVGGICLRGEGRGYGDCATNGGGVVYRLNDAGGRIRIDTSSHVADVVAGVKLWELYLEAAKHQLVVPVTPGTRNVTIGGMLAADVHGKNHHRDGSIFNHVVEVDMLDGLGNLHRVGPLDEWFWFLAGGMGAGAAIVSARIKLEPIPGPYIDQRTTLGKDFAEVIQAMEAADTNRFSVAWIDLANKNGRGIVTSGEWSQDRGWEGSRFEAELTGRKFGLMGTSPVNLINQASVKAFNQLWWERYRRGSSEQTVGLGKFFHPLDGISGWNGLYGGAGFLQYQFVVPETSYQVLETIVDDLISRKVGTPMVVLKKFGAGNPGMLSFPKPGWTLAVDIPTRVPGLGTMLRRYDELVAGSGGRVYLAKDHNVQREHFLEMYPDVTKWQQIRELLDPKDVYQSDLLRRLGLVKQRSES